MADAPAVPTPAAAPSAPASTPAAKPAASTGAPAAVSTGGGSANTTATTVTTPNSPLAEAPAGGTPPETTAERKARLIKYKVDGQERSLNLDEIPDEEMAVRMQFAEASRVRMQEAADLRKHVATLVDALKNDPISVLSDPAFGGLDLEQMVAERLRNKWQEAQLPPVEQEKLKLQRELESRDQQLKKLQGEHQARVQAELDARVYKETETEFLTALEKSNLPKNRQTLYMMAEVAKINLQHGIELSPAQMAAEVSSRLRGQSQFVLQSMKGDSLIDYLGADVVKEVLRHSISKVKGAQAAPPAAPSPLADEPEPASNKEREAARRTSMRAWQKLRRGE